MTAKWYSVVASGSVVAAMAVLLPSRAIVVALTMSAVRMVPP